MIQMQSVIEVADNTGARKVMLEVSEVREGTAAKA